MADLAYHLPKPKYTGFEEALPATTTGPRVVSAASLEGQIVLKKSGPPPYGTRSGWRPRDESDFGDGGAFPEVPVAQYPLGMGKSKGTSNALVLKAGSTISETIAKQGRGAGAIVHHSYKDLIPLRQRADAGEIDLARPSAEEVEATKRKTEEALLGITNRNSAAQRAKSVKQRNSEPTYIRYQGSANQMGKQGGAPTQRIIKVVEKQKDPMEAMYNHHKHKKIPHKAAEAEAPVMHSPPRKVTAEEREAWRIPPSVSNWKNHKGYTIALDKRLAANGRGLEDNTINENFAALSEALYTADRLAREEVRQRAQMQQKLNEREEEKKAEHLRQLAQQAREDRAAAASTRRSRSRSGSRRRDRSASYSSSRSSSSASDSEEERARERAKARRERREEAQRELRQSRMGAERKIQMMARESGRDISEKIALGLAKPTQSGEALYDSRLFGQSSGFAAGFNEDQPYDKPLFQAQDALNTLYKPGTGAQDDGEDEAETYEKITKTKRFDGFSGGMAEQREGPVQFEKDVPRAAGPAGEAKKDADDPFGIDSMIKDVTGGMSGGNAAGKKRYGLQDEGAERDTKRARVHSDGE